MRTFNEIQHFAATAREYREIRQARPLIPARKVVAFINDPDICQNIDQYVCRHDWVINEESDRCLCSSCGMDGDG